MTRQIRRCALYARKSSDEGLEQGFNSLHAQREACAAYVKSQSGEGWKALPDHYDDGGFSGGSMERPGLKQLLADVEAGRIDVIVVYKIDRLTRSLADFARMVELFDRHCVSFVSVTQAFNTTTSMGRLTLNVLLSFAQFEREVTGERIRDKIAASKAKGMWMGGTLPLGYDLPADGTRTLVVNAEEAAVVRRIFADYLELRSVHLLQRRLCDEGVVSKRRVTAKGRVLGGQPFGRGALFHLLRNRIYVGMIVHKGVAHPGMHEAIVAKEDFEATQDQLDDRATRVKAERRQVAETTLTGRVFDADGHPMSPTFTRGRGSKLYRYYVSSPLQRGVSLDAASPRRISASLLEREIETVLRRLLPANEAEPLQQVLRIDVQSDSIVVTVPATHLHAISSRLQLGEHLLPQDRAAGTVRLALALTLQRGNRLVLSGRRGAPSQDMTLVKALRTAHRMLDLDAAGLPVLHAAPDSPYLRKLLRLAFLAPHLQRAILEGTQPPALRLEHLMQREVPLAWRDQPTLFHV